MKAGNEKAMNPLPVQRASQLESHGPQIRWLVQDLWTDQAVGILGGEPKCCKSFLALDLAVSVASAAPCLRQFPVRNVTLLDPRAPASTVTNERWQVNENLRRE